MHIPKLFFFLALFLVISNHTNAQLPEEALDNVRSNLASEKIFIHYDKESYVAGETIWFKVYLLSGFLPSQLSSTVSIDLVNDSGRVIDRRVLPIVNSTTNGDFQLSKDLPQQHFTIRACTRRLMNFGKNSFYYKQLAIFNPSSAQKTIVPQKDFSLYLLPESGNLIGAVNNVVAFKCTDQWGFPADAQGIVVNSAGETVTSFRSVHDGMGKFMITPVNGETYTAVATVGGTTIKAVLPLSRASGALLNILKENGKTYFLINSETVMTEALQPAYILAVMEDMMIFKTPLSPEIKNFKGLIPENAIPAGIMQMTIFNKNDQPLAERLLFIHNKDHIAEGKFNADISSTASLAKNSYSFELADSLYGSYSVSVTDPDKAIGRYGADNIASRFLVTNDLKGYVNDPGYYFNGDDDERKNNLDLVMLTNGWRKFSWNEILSKRLPTITYKDDNYIRLAGMAYNAETTKPLAETNLTIFVKTKDSTNDLMVIPVESDGSFEIPGIIFRDTATLFFQNNSPRNKRVIIQQKNLTISSLFNIATPSFSAPVKPLTFADGQEKVKNLYFTALSQLNAKSILLEDVKITARVKSPLKLLEDRYIRSGAFSSYAAKTLDLVNDPTAKISSQNIFEYLKGRLSSVTVRGNNGDYVLNYRQTMSLSGGMLPMSIFLDESPLSSTLPAASIPVSQIALVKVYPSGFVGAAGNGPGGAIAIYTKKGDDIYNTPRMDNMFQLKLEGYSPVKEFFSPDYSTQARAADDVDQRSTIYWEPNLQTDPFNKKFSFSFFNSDEAKKLKIVLEGMTSDGKLVHVEKMIE